MNDRKDESLLFRTSFLLGPGEGIRELKALIISRTGGWPLPPPWM